MLDRILNWRFWPLFFKELNELRRNRRLIGMMLFPPTVNLVLLGFAMNPEVTDLRLGVVDESRTVQSRELVSAFTESKSFKPAGNFKSIAELSHALSRGDLEAGFVFPSDFAGESTRARVAGVQRPVVIVDLNTSSHT